VVEAPQTRHILLTGSPGSGKSTVLSAVVPRLRAAGWSAFGFWTPEIRRGRRREGFAIELLDGQRQLLASRDRPGPPRVGAYGVQVEAIDQLAVPELERGVAATADGRIVLVMDEIGKMELCSDAFRRAVLAGLDSEARVLGTIMAARHPFADAVKSRADVGLLTVTQDNRDALPQRIFELISLN
jgi:nucleoside-triphosphatase